jgi:hypothetical protein
MATGYADVPGDVLTLVGENGVKLMTHLVSNVYELREWPKEFTEVTVIALKNQKLQNAAIIAQ